MAHLLSEPRLKAVRVALSDLFNDFPVNYASIAETVKDIDPNLLYEILFSEVAPVCYPNIAGAVPTVWTGFDPESLNMMIAERLAARRDRWARRQFDKMLIAWLKYDYNHLWKSLHAELPNTSP